MPFEVGNKVLYNCIEGFGGVAVVIETREDQWCRHKVWLVDGSQPIHWCFDGELEKLPPSMREVNHLRTFSNLILDD